MNQQIAEISHWIEHLKCTGELAVNDKWYVSALAGDASCRQYFRLTVEQPADTSYIVVASPKTRIDNDVFIRLSKAWGACGVPVPEVLAVASDQGFMLIEDFGNVHVYNILTDHLSDDCSNQPLQDLSLHLKALGELHKIRQLPMDSLPIFDDAFLLREMKLFDIWMVQKQLSLASYSGLEDVYRLLIDNALAQPQVTMHRDYHSRNLLLVENNLKVIDFQDAVQGPLTYDLVSLLRDCYFELQPDQIDLLRNQYFEQWKREQTLSATAFENYQDIDSLQFKRWFDLMGLQRHLKVLGLFVRLWVEEGKPRYLSDIRRVFSYVAGVAYEYEELRPFAQWLSAEVEPALLTQSWYTE